MNREPSYSTAPREAALPLWSRIALACGFGFAILMFFAGFVFDLPRPDLSASSETIRSWAQAHQTIILVNRYLQLLAGVCFVVFAAGLYDALRRAERMAREGGMLGLLAFGAAAGTTLIGSVKIAADVAFVRLAADGTSPDVLRALKLLAATSQDLLAFQQGIFWAAASIALLRTRLLPRWIGALGVVGAALIFVSTASVLDPENPLGIAGFFVFPLFATWMLATPATLLWRARAARPASQPGIRAAAVAAA